MIFVDRFEAGRRLAEAVAGRIPAGGALVLGLAPGGVPVASELAHRLGLPLDAFVVRKVTVPGHPEIAAGAVASGGVRVIDDEIVEAFGVPEAEFDEAAGVEASVLEEKERLYRGSRPLPNVLGRTVILVDDAMATGTTVSFAAEALTRLGADHVIVAVPVGPPETCEDVCRHVDDLVCLSQPEPFHAGATVYGTFPPVADSEIQALLAP